MVKSLTWQQQLQHMSAVFGGNPVRAKHRHEFLDSLAGVVRVANVAERVEPPARHPRDELAVVFKMKLEAVRERVVPGHDVGGEGAARKGWREHERLEVADAFGLDARIEGGSAGRKARSQLHKQAGCTVKQAALTRRPDRNRLIARPRYRERVAAEGIAVTSVGRLRVVQGEDYFTSVDPGV